MAEIRKSGNAALRVKGIFCKMIQDCRFIEADELEQAKEDGLVQKITERVVALTKETK